jgi:hypothetical protein
MIFDICVKLPTPKEAVTAMPDGRAGIGPHESHHWARAPDTMNLATGCAAVPSYTRANTFRTAPLLRRVRLTAAYLIKAGGRVRR